MKFYRVKTDYVFYENLYEECGHDTEYSEFFLKKEEADALLHTIENNNDATNEEYNCHTYCYLEEIEIPEDLLRKSLGI